MLEIALLTRGYRESSGRGQGQGTAEEGGGPWSCSWNWMRGEAGGRLLGSRTQTQELSRGRGQPIVEGGPGKSMEIRREPTPCASQN